jgi:hypothetical protein
MKCARWGWPVSKKYCAPPLSARAGEKRGGRHLPRELQGSFHCLRACARVRGVWQREWERCVPPETKLHAANAPLPERTSTSASSSAGGFDSCMLYTSAFPQHRTCTSAVSPRTVERVRLLLDRAHDGGVPVAEARHRRAAGRVDERAPALERDLDAGRAYRRRRPPRRAVQDRRGPLGRQCVLLCFGRGRGRRRGEVVRRHEW